MYTIRDARASDLTQIIQLQKLSLGEGLIPRNEAFWNWKHLQNPFGESSVLLAESDQGEIIGLRAFMKWQWAKGNRNHAALRAVDTATHPKWQGKGIFKDLTLRLCESEQAAGSEFVFNTPNQHSLPGYLKMGWESIGKPDIWIKPIWSIKSWLGTTHNYGLGIPDEFKARHVQGALPFPKNNAGEFIFTALSEKYLKWRYVDIPELDYFGIQVNAGLCFGRLKRTLNKRELRITNMLINSEFDSVELFKQLNTLARASRAHFLTAIDNGDPILHSEFKKNGFFSLKEKSPMVVYKCLNGNRLDWLNKTKWRWQAGDLELF
jgi:GNAT superfamily N-acetyltransferase